MLFFVAVIGLRDGNAEPVYKGTAGTIFILHGEGFGEKKPKVFLEDTGTKRYPVKVQGWSDTTITCTLKKKAPEGSYAIWVKTKTKGSEPLYAGTFRVESPSIESVKPVMPLSGDVVEVTGEFFSSIKPKVYIEKSSGNMKKRCRVASNETDSATGVSILRFIAPFDIAEGDMLVVNNKTGEGRFAFTGIAPPIPEPDPNPDQDPDPPTPDPSPSPDPPVPDPTPSPDPPIPQPTPDPNPPVPL